jgi:hypothetical protein
MHCTWEQVAEIKNKLLQQLIRTFTSQKHTGRKRSLPISTASPKLLRSERVAGHTKVCALCIKSLKLTPSGCGIQAFYRCK